MLNRQTVEQEETLIQTIQNFAQAYEEISVVRMQRVRGAVLVTRQFIAELSEIFGNVKKSYRLAMEEKNQKHTGSFFTLGAGFMGHKQFKSDTTQEKTNATVNIFLSAKGSLQGDIIKRSFNFFMHSIAGDPNSDIIIIGRQGKQLFEQTAPGRKFTYFEMPDSNITIENLRPLMLTVLKYNRTNFYYGQFDNMIKQSPTMTNVTGMVDEQAENTLNQGNNLSAVSQDKHYKTQIGNRYIFEPSVEKIIEFFTTEVFNSFVIQAFHEGELARLASRINSMEQALSNVDRQKGGLRARQHQLKRRLASKKQVDSLAGINLWMTNKLL